MVLTDSVPSIRSTFGAMVAGGMAWFGAQQSGWQSIGIFSGLIIVVIWVLKAAVSYGVDQIVLKWESIPKQIESVRAEVGAGLKQTQADLRDLATKVTESNAGLVEWKRHTEHRLAMLEQRTFGAVRGRDMPAHEHDHDREDTG